MSTYKIVMQHKNDSGNYDTLLPKSSGGRFINISTVAGATLSVTGPNNYSQTYTLSSSEDTHGFSITDNGNYTLKVTNGSKSFSKVVTVNTDGIFSYILYPFSSVLNNNTWEEISQASSLGIASSLWNIGDVKMENINGTIAGASVNGNYGFFIIDFDHNSEIEGQGISFMGFKSASNDGIEICLTKNTGGQGSGFQMNTSDTIVGGWESCYMRKTIIPQFKNLLSINLQKSLKSVTIYTDNIGYTSQTGPDEASFVTPTVDNIYLAAEFEVFGKRTWANSAEQNYQTQFAYYKNRASKIKYDFLSPTSSVWWWSRSPTVSVQKTSFCRMEQTSSSPFLASYSYGFSPIIRI